MAFGLHSVLRTYLDPFRSVVDSFPEGVLPFPPNVFFFLGPFQFIPDTPCRFFIPFEAGVAPRPSTLVHLFHLCMSAVDFPSVTAFTLPPFKTVPTFGSTFLLFVPFSRAVGNGFGFLDFPFGPSIIPSTTMAILSPAVILAFSVERFSESLRQCSNCPLSRRCLRTVVLTWWRLWTRTLFFIC